MSTILRDLRFALRMLRKNLGFTVVVVFTLALGIGANTAIFSVVNAVLLRPLPFDDPERLVMIWQTDPARGNMEVVSSYPTVQDWRELNHVFEHIGSFTAGNYTLTGTEQPERIGGARVSPDFLSVLRVRPLLGRLFQTDEGQPGAANVVILSYRFWEEKFGGDPEVVGQTLSLDGLDFDIIGVLPTDCDFPVLITGADVWLTTALDVRYWERREMSLLRVVGRLKPGVTLQTAQADMDVVMRQMEQEHTSLYKQQGVRLAPLLDQVVGEVRPMLWLLLGAVGLVLLIACANIASLFLVRTTGRRAEFAIRAAIGGGRGHLFRQLLTESCVVCVAGGVCGVLLGMFCLDLLADSLSNILPRAGSIELDARVLGFTLATTVLAILIFGTTPILNVSRTRLQDLLKEGAVPLAGSRRHRLQSGLVVVETAAALVLLVGAGLLTRSFQRLMQVDPGFEPNNLLRFQLNVGFSRPIDYSQRAAFYSELLERLEALPGVDSAFAGTGLPLWPSSTILGVFVEGRPRQPKEEVEIAGYSAISDNYFEGLGVPLAKGRMFTDLDRRGAPGVMIINETLARRVFPNEDPLGKKIRGLMQLSDNDPKSYEIVGVVGDVLDSIPGEPRSCMYIPYNQQTWPFMNVGLRTGAEPAGMISAVREQLAQLTREEAAFSFGTMNERLSILMAKPRLIMDLLGMFAVVALLLAAVGLYGLLAHSAAQRTREIGLRLALGAQRTNVLMLILKRGLILTSAGIGVGVAVALVATRLLSSQLYEVEATDPLTFAGVSLLLASIALLACYLPARRATKVDPMVALRCE